MNMKFILCKTYQEVTEKATEIIANEELDLVVCEMAHFGFEHIAPYLKDCRAKQVVFNHYQLRKERDIEQLKQCGGFAFPVIMAEDGLVLQP